MRVLDSPFDISRPTDYLNYAIQTVALVAALVYTAVRVINFITKGLQSTKESLTRRGVTLSEHGMAIKTKKRMDQDDYYDATQRYVTLTALLRFVYAPLI